MSVDLPAIVERYADGAQADAVLSTGEVDAAPHQLYDPLDGPTEDALRASIRRFGVIVPIVVDQRGRIIDGHHRTRIANELGVRCVQQVRRVRDDDEARELARTLNEDRRQLDPEQRRAVVADLRAQGHSTRAVARALRVDQSTVVRDQEAISPDAQASREIAGLDGKAYGKPPELKRCSSCRVEKPLESFGRDRTSSDGRGYECRVCAAERLTKGEDKVLARRADVERLRSTGMTRAQIAEQLGVTERTISSDFAALGLDVVKPKGNGRRSEAAAERRAMVQGLADEGFGVAEIARRLGVGRSVVSDDFAELGLKRAKSREAVQEREDTIRRMAGEGYTSRQISAEVGIGVGSVKAAAARIGVEIAADHVVGRTRQIDSTRIVEQICLDVEHVTAGTDLIEWDQLDPGRLDGWVSSLDRAIKSLQGFKRQLAKELTQ